MVLVLKEATVLLRGKQYVQLSMVYSVWFWKCSSWTTSISRIWELDRNADCGWTVTESETLGVGLSSLYLPTPKIMMPARVGEQLV